MGGERTWKDGQSRMKGRWMKWRKALKIKRLVREIETSLLCWIYQRASEVPKMSIKEDQKGFEAAVNATLLFTGMESEWSQKIA